MPGSVLFHNVPAALREEFKGNVRKKMCQNEYANSILQKRKSKWHCLGFSAFTDNWLHFNKSVFLCNILCVVFCI